ncbi:MAG: hypothetical protein M1834_009558 [Cirrosporium novae-zelandiae]|nr:MAG: hypothetical protein M1834_009558 [Cirrosporium novae-zelandiae]
MAQTKRQIFPSNQTLKDRAVNLYTTLLHAITGSIAELVRKSLKARTVDFFKGPLAGKPIDEILGTVQKNDVKNQMLADIGNFAIQSKPELRAIRWDTKKTEVEARGIRTDLGNVKGIAQGIKGQLSGVEDMVLEVKRKQNEILKRQDEKAQNDGIRAKNDLFQLFLDELRSKDPLRLRTSLAPRILSTPGPFLSLAELLTLLQIPHMMTSNDLDYVLRQGSDFDLTAQGQARWLLRTRQFQGWLSPRDSDLLLVDGNTDSSIGGGLSPLSLLCATLVLSFFKMRPRPISLHFFCGQHDAPDDVLKGPNGLIRSLITQLLLTHQMFTLYFINSHQHCTGLEAQSLAALCNTFQKLVKQLPPRTLIYCVLDGISLYEGTDWDGDLAFVVDRLNKIVKDECLQPTFKLLMTSPYFTRSIQRQIKPSQHVVLQEGIADGQSISQRSLW